MDRSAPRVGIAIVSFNTRELLRDCLDSLGKCSLSLQIVVVDNQSADGSAVMLGQHFPHVELIEPGRNLGFAGGTNLAICHLLGQGAGVGGQGSEDRGSDTIPCGSPMPGDTHTGCDYILLLNSDTVVHSGAIEALVDFLDAHPRVGMVGPRLLNTDGSLQTAAFRFPTLSMTALDLFPPGEVLPGRLYSSWWHGRYIQEEQGNEPFPIDHPLGACILVRRRMIEEIGLLDEGYFMYAEEVDWCLRARRAGWAIWQLPEAWVTHVGGASTSQFRARMHVALYQSRLRFFQKHYGLWGIRMHRLVIAAGSLRAILLCWRDYATRRISRDMLRERLWSHTSVLKLMLEKVLSAKC